MKSIKIEGFPHFSELIDLERRSNLSLEITNTRKRAIINENQICICEKHVYNRF